MSEYKFKPTKTIKKYLEEGKSLIGTKIQVTGRITRFRAQSKMFFGALCDGSESTGLQFIYTTSAKSDTKSDVKSDTDLIDKLKKCTEGTSVTVAGKIVESPAKGQDIELQLEEVQVLSTVDEPDQYKYGASVRKKRQPKEWAEVLKGLRQDIYGRFRHKIIQSITRIRSRAKFSLMKFFIEREFVQVDTPIITKSDCEGAGEMFSVTTFDFDKIPRTKEGDVDFTQDFFKEESKLTVSGQLEAESLAQTLHKVFTFGPTFRAEDSHTSRHLAEFWMLEPELVFGDKDKLKRFSRLMDLEEDMLKYVMKDMMEYCKKDLEYLKKTICPDLFDRYELILSSDFERVTYTEAIEILQTAVKDGQEFEDKEIFWGMDLASEHECYLTDKYKKPVFVTHYPQDLKSFYMKADEDCEKDRVTCQAVDLLIPGIGELCGGSMREDDPEKLLSVMKDKKKMSTKDLEWYIKLRKDGGLPTGGFGLGFERLVFYLTGVKSVRDVIAFSRYPGHI